MKKTGPLFYNGNSILLVLCILLSACTTDGDHTPYPSNFIFEYSGAINGSYNSSKFSDPYFVMYGGGAGDNYLSTTSIHWIIPKTSADIVILNIKSLAPLIEGQIFKNDSINSSVDGIIGFSAPIKTTHSLNRGDEYTIADSSGYRSINISFSLRAFDLTPTSYSLEGTFSGQFARGQDTLNVMNGSVYFRY